MRIQKYFPSESPGLHSQRGGGLLTIVAVLGLLLVLVQGSIFYKSKGSSKFLGAEKTKVLAQQMAEAGIEANIGDLGRRKTRVRAGLIDSATYVNKHLGGGSYTSKLSTVAMGTKADTVDLISTGTVGSGTHTVHARLKLRKAMDTTTALIPKTVQVPTQVIGTKNVTIPAATAASMPGINSTVNYNACISSGSATCKVCHVPGGNIALATVLNVAAGTIAPVHGGHVGDYVTTNSTCDLFTNHVVTVPDTTIAMVDQTAYDTTLAIDTLIKVHILSWR